MNCLGVDHPCHDAALRAQARSCPRDQVSASKRTRPEIHGWLSVLHGLTIAYCGLWHRLKTNGWAPLPETGPAILIANHTCGIDHLIFRRAAAGCSAS